MGIQMFSDSFDMVPYWTWFLLLSRFNGLLMVIPGIGTKQVPNLVRMTASMIIAGIIVAAGTRADLPDSMAGGGFMLISEFLLGYVIGSIPVFIIGALAVSGQVTSASMGLGMANMMDPSIGQSVAVLARIESLVATIVFLAVDGHHVFLRALGGVDERIAVGVFRPDAALAAGMIELFQYSFELAIVVTAPILVTILITQFVLGLITKSVPQVNIFIISLPLTIGLGLFITVYTLPIMADKILMVFVTFEEWISKFIAGA